jgi:hypothetical protein
MVNKKKSSNQYLNRASIVKNDEFYTQLSDIERELGHYKEHFKGKVIFCNCDDPEESNFFKYFCLSFEFLGLKKLISTHFEKDKPSYKLEIVRDVNGDGKIDCLDTVKTPLKQNGDFRSPECIEILKEADIIVTNPPFSLFREYVAQLIEYEKKFLIIGNKNSITYKEIFRLIKENKMWLGYRNINSDMWFILPDSIDKWEKEENGYKLKHIMGCWFTNMDVKKRHENLLLYKTYYGDEDNYPKYDDYDAINVNKVKEIPMDYEGIIGVPITYIGQYNPDQFEILGLDDHRLEYPKWRGRGPDLNGKPIYRRIIIKNKKV